MRTFLSAIQLYGENSKWRFDWIVPFYNSRILVYGSIAELSAYWVLANYLIEQEGGILIGIGDYHNGPLFDLNLLAEYIFSLNGDPLDVFESLLVGVAYNFEQLEKLIENTSSLKPTMIVLLNVDRLCNKVADFSILNNLISRFFNRNLAPIIITSSTNVKSKRYPPEPNVSHYIRHLCDVIAFIKPTRYKNIAKFFITKHPYLPYSIEYLRLGGLYGSEYSLY